MSRTKNPGEKKRLSLAKDYRTFALEGNKTFRSAWRLKKAKTNRAFRRAATIALASPAEFETGDPPELAVTKPKRSLAKYGVVSLGQSISIRNDESRRLRWNMRVLEKNPDALAATIARMKPKRRS